jgi:hypothetical protein
MPDKIEGNAPGHEVAQRAVAMRGKRDGIRARLACRFQDGLVHALAWERMLQDRLNRDPGGK